MNSCPTCKMEIPTDAPSCSHCGESLDEAANRRLDSHDQAPRGEKDDAHPKLSLKLSAVDSIKQGGVGLTLPFPHKYSHKGKMMNKLVSLLILVSLTLSTIAPLHAQQHAQPPDDIVRISTNLVQIDAVVTDKDGNPVRNLTATDFEVLQDGKTQKSVSLSYVNTEIRDQSVALEKKDKKAPLAPQIPHRG